MARHQLPDDSWKGNYFIRMQISIIVVLILMLTVAKMEIRSPSDSDTAAKKQEIVKMEEVVMTEHEKTPPPPPRPQVPIEVPNDEVVEDVAINLNTELNMDDKLTLPPPPDNTGKESDDEQIFVIVESPPKLIGGLKGLQQDITYPEMARRAGIEGRVYVQFIINKQGEVEDPHVLRGIGGGCDKEAIRVIGQARFKPGMQRGRPVKVRYSMPIVFQLDQSS